MIKEIEKKAQELKGEKLYSVEEINEMGLILNTKLKPSRFTLYRLIHRNQLPFVNLGTENLPKYFIKGKHLKKYVYDRYREMVNG